MGTPETGLSEPQLTVKEISISQPSKLPEFIAGRLRQFDNAWTEITSDPEILSMIAGVKVEFDCPLDQLPQLSYTKSSISSVKECEIIDAEILKLKGKQVISPCEHCLGEVISPVFTRPKKDGSHRMILNLKRSR